MKYFNFSSGEWHFTMVQDGQTQFDMNGNFSPEFKDAASRSDLEGLSADAVELSINILLAEKNGQKILIDTGVGQDFGGGEGRLPQSFAALGIKPESIDAVILTHGHWDHIGGISDDAGQPRFPNARYFMPHGEWTYWTSEEVLQSVWERYAQFARRHLPPIATRIEPFLPGVEILPNIHTLDARGHTPAQAAILFSDPNGGLLHLADSAHHPLQISHPGLNSNSEQFPVDSIASRYRLLRKASEQDLLLAAYHFPFPGIGRVKAGENEVFNWQPI